MSQDEEEVDEFELQLKQEELERLAKEEGSTLPKGTTYTDDDGTVMEWDHERKAYFPKIDADFIAQYQINYGASSDQNQDGWERLTEEEKQARYDEYWNSYYQAYSKEQPALPKIDVEGNEIEEGEEEEKSEKKQKSKKDKSGENSAGVETDVTASTDEVVSDPTSEEHYQYNLYYFGQEYADAYRDYYTDHPDEAAMPDWIAQRSSERGEGSVSENKDKKKGKQKPEKGEKRKEPPREEGWFEMDSEASTQLYVSGLPSDVTEEEFKEVMSKCGLIMFDPLTRKPKLKLYMDKEGNLKGDGLCTYIKPESVELALNILDEFEVRGHRISVQRAKFELKGDFDPKKKRKKLSNKAKQKLKEKQQRLFDWRPDKNPYERSKNERIVILKNMFDVSEFDADPTLINEFRADVRDECLKFGDVKKVVLYDRNPEGVISVTFKEAEEADKCIAALNGRWFAKRRITAAAHDGKTRYEVQETEEEKAKRLAGWDSFLADDTQTKTAAPSSLTEGGSGGTGGVGGTDEGEASAAGQEVLQGEAGGTSGGVSGVLVEDVEEREGLDTGGASEV
ncbi:HIV Tat-specific factor 1 homolog, partial [Aplysia californica]|uniref:HIV Tat-specific factor 1 homolog n=1 Tax=Aplysia californica TaxID=6500 RepID=A0ABM1W3R1_APLCA